jgi:hypothetical protein
MSRTVQATKKPYCKVCFDAGKPESEYTSHWVRSLPDRNGKTTVTCPTLLDTNCRYCYQSGHTTKFCKVLEKQNKDRERAQMEPKKTKQMAPKEKKPASVFAGLMDSDSEDEVKVSKPVENYPVLCAPVKKVEVEKKEVKTGWAAIAAKPAEVKKAVEPTKPTGLVLLSDYIKPEPKVEEKKLAPWANKQTVVKKSWADESDSEDECEVYQPYSFAVAVEEDETW